MDSSAVKQLRRIALTVARFLALMLRAVKRGAEWPDQIAVSKAVLLRPAPKGQQLRDKTAFSACNALQAL
eukprot:5532531-Alexandrium_andersonii.AAC.1